MKVKTNTQIAVESATMQMRMDLAEVVACYGKGTPIIRWCRRCLLMFPNVALEMLSDPLANNGACE